MSFKLKKLLLLNKLFVLIIFTCFSCNNLKKSESSPSKKEEMNKTGGNLSKSDTSSVEPSYSIPENQQSDSNQVDNELKEVEIHHKHPNQERLDSIKRAKGKGKK